MFDIRKVQEKVMYEAVRAKAMQMWLVKWYTAVRRPLIRKIILTG